MIAAVISTILRNFFVVLFAVAVLVTIAKLRRYRMARQPVDGAYVFWGELLFYNVGITFVLVGILHAYFQQIAAPSIGWAPSPFEYELGWMEIPLGAVAIAALWAGFEFRLAASIVFVVFSIAAAAGHVEQMLCCHNYAPNNAGLLVWFNDVLIPVMVTFLAIRSLANRRTYQPRWPGRY